LTILTGTTHFHWITIAGAVLDANCLYSGSQDWVWLWSKGMNMRIICKKWCGAKRQGFILNLPPFTPLATSRTPKHNKFNAISRMNRCILLTLSTDSVRKLVILVIIVDHQKVWGLMMARSESSEAHS
jgi:hypothetical protein